LLMRLRSLFADVLADLELAQFVDHVGTDEQRNQQRRQRRKRGTKGQIPKDTERAEIRKQLLIEQPVEQTSSGKGKGVIGRYLIVPSVSACVSLEIAPVPDYIPAWRVASVVNSVSQSWERRRSCKRRQSR